MGEVTIVGLGPAGLDRLPAATIALLDDAGTAVVVRTTRHPAAAELAARREVVACDDLYDSAGDFDSVYEAIAGRVLDAATNGPVIYAVPGSAVVGERAVPLVVAACRDRGVAVDILPGESFLDLVYARTGVDPIASGVQILDGRALPDPLPLHVPTVITQVDHPGVVGDVALALGRVLEPETQVTVVERLGSPDESLRVIELADLPRLPVHDRTSLLVSAHDAGWLGLVGTNRRLRVECPWDRSQTHHSLVSHLVEETYEVVEALSALGPDAPGGDPDYGAYAEVEEELGDLLLQVVFHATLAAEAGAFDVEEVAEGIRRKLVRRHPHVFGEVEASTPDEVIANWEDLKQEEKQRTSLMDDIPASLPALARAEKMQRRAASVGFDWDAVGPVLSKVREEVDELEAAIADPTEAASELGDLLFAAVNLSRHLKVDAELALRHAADRFAARFRGVEGLAVARGMDLASASLDELDRLWDEIKSAGGDAG